MRRLFDLVPEEQRLVLIYEEFFADPERHYRESFFICGSLTWLRTEEAHSP